MWLSILLVLFGWFAAALALGLIAGKSMAAANRFELYTHHPKENFDKDAWVDPAKLTEIKENQPAGRPARKAHFKDLEPVRH